MCGINVPITVTGRRDPSGAGLLGLTIFHTSWIIGEPLTAIIAKVAIIPLPDFWVWAPLCISGSLAALRQPGHGGRGCVRSCAIGRSQPT
jgi:hypothetical protein